MRVGTVSIEHSVECRRCSKRVYGGTQKRMYLWFTLHYATRHNWRDPFVLKVMWDLWRWTP